MCKISVCCLRFVEVILQAFSLTLLMKKKHLRNASANNYNCFNTNENIV